MSASDMNRLVQDLQQPALRETLGASLAQCGSAADAAATLQRAGYDITAQELQQASAGLSDQALDQVDGGSLFSAWLREGVGQEFFRSRC